MLREKGVDELRHDGVVVADDAGEDASRRDRSRRMRLVANLVLHLTGDATDGRPRGRSAPSVGRTLVRGDPPAMVRFYSRGKESMGHGSIGPWVNAGLSLMRHAPIRPGLFAGSGGPWSDRVIMGGRPPMPSPAELATRPLVFAHRRRPRFWVPKTRPLALDNGSLPPAPTRPIDVQLLRRRSRPSVIHDTDARPYDETRAVLVAGRTIAELAAIDATIRYGPISSTPGLASACRRWTPPARPGRAITYIEGAEIPARLAVVDSVRRANATVRPSPGIVFSSRWWARPRRAGPEIPTAPVSRARACRALRRSWLCLATGAACLPASFQGARARGSHSRRVTGRFVGAVHRPPQCAVQVCHRVNEELETNATSLFLHMASTVLI